MAFEDLRHLQKEELKNMLRKNTGNGWTVLVMDEVGQSIIAPLLKVGDLRALGVALHLSLTQKRDQVQGATAIYFIAPTSENIKLIVDDISRQLYKKYEINFTFSVSSTILQDLAIATAALPWVVDNITVTDRYQQFCALTDRSFTLNLKSCFKAMYAPGIPDQLIEDNLESVANGLLSVFITLRQLPMILCSTHNSSPSKMVARTIAKKFNELLQTPLGRDINLPGMSRPALVLLDREYDIGTMLHHSWLYRGLLHDMFSLKLNRVSLSVGSESKSYDLDESVDSFWGGHADKPFPVVAVSVGEAFDEYQKGMKGITGNVSSDTLAMAVSSAPQMVETKRYLDMHSTLATELVRQIKTRGIDKWFETELSYPNTLTNLQTLIGNIKTMEGSSEDKIRALVLLYIAKGSSASSVQVSALKSGIAEAGGDPSIITFLDSLAHVRAIEDSTTAPSDVKLLPSATAWGAKVLERGVGLMQGIKLMRGDREFKLVKAARRVLERDEHATSSFMVIDPKNPDANVSWRPGSQPAVVFVIGGGTYDESHAFQLFGENSKRQVFYGSSDYPCPEDFLKDLSGLN